MDIKGRREKELWLQAFKTVPNVDIYVLSSKRPRGRFFLPNYRVPRSARWFKKYKKINGSRLGGTRTHGTEVLTLRSGLVSRYAERRSSADCRTPRRAHRTEFELGPKGSTNTFD